LNRPPGATDIAVLTFGGRRVPRALQGLAVVEPGDIDAALASVRRVVVVGADADLAAVLTQLLRAELLNVELAYVPRRRTPATRAYRLPAGRRAARRARRGSAQRVPLIRDETGSAIVGAAEWGPAGDAPLLHGEAVVDEARSRRWLTGRAAQLGGVGISVVRDGVVAPRTTRRSTIYRHTEGWLAVR
jgi:hypothetical protein